MRYVTEPSLFGAIKFKEENYMPEINEHKNPLKSFSDISLAIAMYDHNGTGSRELITAMYKKINTIHKIVCEIEQDKDFKIIGEYIRKALES